MRRRAPATLSSRAPLRVLTGFGEAVRSASRYAAPTTVEELSHVMTRARHEGLSITFRGAGRSYGDAALNRGGLVVDLSGLSRMLSWEPRTGIATAEGGLTIEGLWRRTLLDGYWPAVVPGTMRPTLAGCLSTNIHGKNNFKAGTFGEHVLDFHLLVPTGDVLRCSREENADVFHAAIGGLGLLGAVTRVRLQLKRVESGYLRVRAATAPGLSALFDRFEELLPESDYLVAWVDCTSRGRALGRGVLHAARYLSGSEDPLGPASLKAEAQSLPPRILGIPRDQLWRLMRPFTNNPGARLVNTARFWSSRLKDGGTYLQSHVAFAFLLDYIPGWWLAYGREGLIQYQAFVPRGSAREAFRELLELAQAERLPPYLGVLKRHRPDPFLLSHAVDGWSLALDFRVPPGQRERLWALTERMTELVLKANGRFYLAKDAVLRAQDLELAYGREPLARFRALKSRLDPGNLLSSELSRRLLGR